MADQGRWFKLWCAILTDDKLQGLSPADRWAWVALGAHTKQSGTRGVIHISERNAALAGAMGIDVTELFATCCRLPHVTCQKSDNGEFTVTWRNWTKYQEDSTVAQRVSRLRSKKRREENIKAVPPNPQRFAHANVTVEQPNGLLTISDIHESKKAAARALLKQAFPNQPIPE